MAAKQVKGLAQQLTKTAELWPTDPFRPNLQLSVFLQSLAGHPNLTPRAVQAARSLLNNEVRAKYPTPERLLHPASMPMHYDRLLEGYQKSAQGIKRPLWKTFFGIW